MTKYKIGNGIIHYLKHIQEHKKHPHLSSFFEKETFTFEPNPAGRQS